MTTFYTNKMFWTKSTPYLSATEDELLARLSNGEPTFEMTGDCEAICNMYFDIDYKLGEQEFCENVNDVIKETGKRYINECVRNVLKVEPTIAVATSSCPTKYSWRFFIPNVKMKKNEMCAFIKKMNDYIEQTSDIYDYIENKGGLFDTGIYTHNRLMRCINTSKPDENRPLLLVEGQLKDTLINTTAKATLVSYEIEKRPSSPTSVSDTSVLNDNYSELLAIIGNTGHKRETWLTLCSWFVNNRNKASFLDFVAPEWRDEAEKLFDDFAKNKRPCSIYALDNIAKNKNETAYIDWRRRHNKFITVEILEKGCNDVSQFVAPRLKQNLIYCNDCWYQYDKQCCLWRITKRPDALVITHIQREIDEVREHVLYKKNRTEDDKEKEGLSKLEKKFIQYHKEVSNSSYVSQTLKCLSTYVFDADFSKILDNQSGFVAFKNGILNLKTLEFREGLLQSDFITKTIPYNYVRKNDNDEDVIEVRTALKKICNWNDTHLDYYLSCIGYAMTGYSNREQNFWYLRGQTAENGKSVIFEALEKIMPNYVIKGTNTFLDKGAELKKEVPTWKGVRILWLNEVSTKMKDEDLLKAVCDGTDFKYNRNYATEAEKVSILFKLFCVSNNSLSVKGDAGIARRFKLLQFNSQFQVSTTQDDVASLQFVRNKTFSDDLCGKWRDALLHLIFSYSSDYLVNDALKPYPDEWNEEAKENIADNNKFAEWFEENFEIYWAGTCGRLELESYLPQQFKTLSIKDELSRMKIPYKYDPKKEKRFNGKKSKGVYEGFKKKEDTDEDIDIVEE